MKHRIFILAAVVLSTALLAGCAGAAASSAAPSSSAAVPASSAASAASSAAQAGGVQYISGTVSDLSSMNDIAVKSDDGHLYYFSPEGAQVTGAGCFAGNTITVTFEGNLDKNTTNVQSVKVVEMETGGSADVSAAAQSAASDPSAETRFISGTVGEGTAMNTLQLNGYDGFTYLFSTEDVEISGPGVTIGDNCTVAYKGQLDPTLTGVQNVTVLRAATSELGSDGQAAVQSQQRPDKVMTGVVSSESTMSFLVVAGDDGATYSLPIEGLNLTGSVLVNARVSIHYTGTLTDNDNSNVNYVVIG